MIVQLLLKKLLHIPCPAPTHEAGMRDVLEQECRNAGLHWQRDAVGNLLIRLERGACSCPPIVFLAHMDHPAGELVAASEIEVLGGLPSQGLTEIAWESAGERLHPVECITRGTQRFLRLEYPSRLPIGTPFRPALERFRQTKKTLSGWAMDDQAGVAAILSAFITLAHSDRPCKAWALFTRAEEIGFLGAIQAFRAGMVPKDAAIVSVEASAQRPNAVLGGGVIVRTGDRRSCFDPALTAWLLSTAHRLQHDDPSFLVQRALMDGGACEATAAQALGWRAAGLSLPLGNYHNRGPRGRLAPERIHADDLQGASTLITAAIASWPQACLDQRDSELIDHILAQAPRQVSEKTQ